MIAGFIFLRLRGILGKRTGFEGKASPQFEEMLKNINPETKINKKTDFDENAKKDFLKGAKIAYETIITDFGDSDNKLTTSKPLLSNKIYDQFNTALKERGKRGHLAEITFIGVNSTLSNNIEIGKDNWIGPGITIMKSTEDSLIFKKNNIEPIKEINEKLDPNLHQAMMEVEDDAKDPGTIVQEIQKGFTIKDRLLRPSLVGVSKKVTKKVNLK